MLIGQRSGAVVFWSVQGDAVAGVEVGDTTAGLRQVGALRGGRKR